MKTEDVGFLRGPFLPLYLGNFFLSLHLFSIIYVNSVFLTQFVGEGAVGIVFALASLAAIAGLLGAPALLRRMGSMKALVSVTLFEAIGITGFAFVKDLSSAVLFFVVYFVGSTLLLYFLDVFLETVQGHENTTGSRRGIFLTIANATLIISPLLGATLLGESNFTRLYLFSAGVLIPFLLIVLYGLKDIQDPPYKEFALRKTFFELKAQSAIYHICIAQFLLRLFYALAVIYFPLYLHQHIGFSWQEIGLLLAIVLLPFALLEFPAGKIADRYLGEKELLAIGFLILSISVGLLAFLTTTSFLIWTAALFMTRVGASLIEITTESYFFKHVRGKDAHFISVFRMLQPAAYIGGPLLTSALLLFVDLHSTFFLWGALFLFGLPLSLLLKDTR